MFNLVLFGPPGAGKGTQAEKLIEKYGFNHISTGEVIREQIRKGTELGRSVQSYIEKGQLAPDGLVIDIIADYVAKQTPKATSSTASRARPCRPKPSTRSWRRTVRR